MTYIPEVVRNPDVFRCGKVVWPDAGILIPIFGEYFLGFRRHLFVFQVWGVFSSDTRYLELLNDTFLMEGTCHHQLPTLIQSKIIFFKKRWYLNDTSFWIKCFRIQKELRKTQHNWWQFVDIYVLYLHLCCNVEYIWCFARFGTSCTILKTWNTPMEECYF